MKRMVLAVFALSALAALAMPTKEEQAEAQSIALELLKVHIDANKRGKESHEAVGDAAMALAGNAKGEAAKFVLLKGAVSYYGRGRAYEKAADAVEAIMSQVADVPPETMNAIVSKAAANATGKNAPRLVALKKAIARRANAKRSLEALEPNLKKSPNDPSLKRMHAELVAAMGDWKAALAEFAVLGGAVGMIAEDESANTAASADFWWGYVPAAPEAKDAIKEHAAELYRQALDNGELEGLKRNLAEQRIAGFTPVLAPVAKDVASKAVAPKVEYKFNYRVENGNAILTGQPCVTPLPEGVLVVPDKIDGFKVTRLDEHMAFFNCSKMTKIVLPVGLESVGFGNFLCGCHSLADIEIPKSNTLCAALDGVLYSKDMKTVVAYPKARDKIMLSPRAKSIGRAAFNSCMFTEAKVPLGIERIESHAFECCPQLSCVEFPTSVKELWMQLFQKDSALKKVVFNGNAPNVHIIGRYGFFSYAPPDIAIEVKKGSKGWKSPGSTELPDRWPVNGGDSRPIRYMQ